MENTPESAPPVSMKYWRSYLFLFDNPKWLVNMLLGAVCLIIPVLGGIVFMGYGYEAVEMMHRRGKDDQYPDFDFNRFVKYLVRGCLPFIWQIIMGIPAAIIMWVFYFIVMIVVIGTGGNEPPNSAVFALVLFFVILVMIAISLAMSVILAPLLLRSGLSQQLGFEQAISFVQDFLKRVGKELILSQLFLFGTAI